jgi:hypothetical protein
MNRAATLSRKARRQAVRRKARQRKIITAGLLGLGVLLVAWGIYASVAGKRVDADALTYSPGDVANDRPFVAIHEMGDGPPIPFMPKDQPQPAILVPETSHNFGSIGPTDVVERKFIIRNTGDAPLTISRAYTTCGCTKAEFTSSVIPPGKVVEATLIFDAGFHDTAGQTVRRGLIIENNDPRHSQAEIWTQASVRNN